MNFKSDFLFNYLHHAPMALAIERSLECAIFAQQEFTAPILDIGCGDGIFASMLFRDCIDVGIDPRVCELEQARMCGIYKEVFQCNGVRIPHEDGVFNTIFCNSVLEHVPRMHATLKEVHRLLSPPGRFYVTVPTDMFDHYTVLYQLLSFLRLHHLAEVYRNHFNRFWKHCNYYSRKEWEEIFAVSGFETVHVIPYAAKRLCMMNDFLTIFAFPSFMVKKITHQWFLWRNLRKLYAPLVYRYARFLIERYEKENRGGILFFSLAKVHST